MITNSIEDRFWSKVDIKDKDNCWLWLAGKTKDNYGQFNYKGKLYLAHRLAFELYYKRKIEDDMILLHSCDNRLCCNYHHLKEGTKQDNAIDMHNKGRAVDNRGMKHGRHKLTDTQVIEIRQKREDGELLSTLAFEYDVSERVISGISDRKLWRHI